MTISTTDNLRQYDGSGSTGPFPFPLKFFDDEDLEVILTDAEGLDSVLVLTTDYTVDGAGDPEGGSVTTVDPVAVGEKITIRRNMEMTQKADYEENDNFPAESHERALDKLTILIQQLNEIINRCLRIPASSNPMVDTKLPSPAANNYLAWNAAANAIINVAALVPSAIVSSFMAAVLDDEDAAEVLATLGFNASLADLNKITGLLLGTQSLAGLDVNGDADISGTLNIGSDGARKVVPGGTMVDDGANGLCAMSSEKLAVSTVISAGPFETIGPTGSGAQNIWTALDLVPAGANWIRIRIYNTFVGSEAAGTYGDITVYCQKNGGLWDASQPNKVSFCRGVAVTGGQISGVSINEATVPIDEDGIFEAAYTYNAADTRDISFHLVGWGYNP